MVIDTLMIHGRPPRMRSTSPLPRSAGCTHGQIQLYKQKLFFHMDMKNYAQRQTDILHCQIKPAARFEGTKRKRSDAACSSGITNFPPPHLGAIEPMLLWANCADRLGRTGSAQLKNGFAGANPAP
ncbi:hypothetical protein GQ55_2G309300 [Panicum hallii var. hallii]|uniref:Uncharacterized protein n=1 Tax=Panicum hallii var. hallii TaxID=1504633 RepID=A0A2T7EUA5_9POAL|nr:hypothetical protein GQ55_2G309300 [Panicum hallii var. hallii]